MARSTTSPMLDVLDGFERSRHDLRASTMRGYKAGVWRLTIDIARRRGLEVPVARAQARPVLAPITLATLTLDNANAYIGSLLKRKKKTQAHHCARAIVIFAEWCVQARILATNPLAGFTVPHQPKNRRQPFQDADIPIIRRAARETGCGERDEALVVVAIACGLRKDELRQLVWPDDVDLRGRMLYIRDRSATVTGADGVKSDAAIRRVPLEPEVIALLDAYIEDWRPSRQAGPLFLNNHGDPLSYDGVASVCRRIKARLPREMDFKIHRGRNTAITNWLRTGNDLHTVMKLAGHKNPKVTEQYAGDFTDAELRTLVRPSFSTIYRKTA